jgi:hypothetical protein
VNVFDARRCGDDVQALLSLLLKSAALLRARWE